MNVFVTGATGFVGSHLVQIALSDGHRVTALRRSDASRPCIPWHLEPAWLTKEIGAIGADDLVGSDVLIHLAAVGVSPKPSSWEECLEVNVRQSIRLFREAAMAGVNRIVVGGTFAEYGAAGVRYERIPVSAPLEPSGAYATSKAALSMAGRALAGELKIEIVHARLFSLFGEGQFEQNFWPALRAAALSGQDFPMTAGEQIRDFIPVEAAARHLLATASGSFKVPGGFRAVNIASGTPVRLVDFAHTWWRKWEAEGRIIAGAVPYRAGESMVYVPEIEPLI